MNENIPHVTEGKVIGDSAFFTLANEMLGKECIRLCDFTESLDKDLAKKKENIAEYKCAKYRYAAVGRIYNLLKHGHMVYHRSAVLFDIENSIKNNDGLWALCNNAPDEEKIDYKLYYGISSIACEMHTKCLEKLQNANDFERIELEERIGGLLYGKECLDEAWQKRKEVVK